MATYFVPVEGLRVEQPWDVGPVRLHSSESASAALDRVSADVTTNGSSFAASVSYQETIGALRTVTVAEVTASDVGSAVDVVRDALAVLRVFHFWEQVFKGTPGFGLPGEVVVSSIRYIEVGEAGRVGVGWRRHGGSLGYTFGEDARTRWDGSAGLACAAGAVGSSTPTEAQRRALWGCRLLSDALLEHRPDHKLLSLVRALEILTLERTTNVQTFRLARRLAFLTCGNDPGAPTCGRGRPTCPYLALDPGVRTQREELKRIRDRATSDISWLCTEWTQIVEWYDARSDAVHEATSGLAPEEVHRVEYWIVRYLAPAILDWLGRHPDDPLGELDQAIADLPAPPDWEAVIAQT